MPRAAPVTSAALRYCGMGKPMYNLDIALRVASGIAIAGLKSRMPEADNADTSPRKPGTAQWCC